MAQLIKLQDYVSRYETDMTRYPAQYVRLKKQQWEKLKEAWESGTTQFENEWLKQEISAEKQGIFNKLKQFFRREEETFVEEFDVQQEKTDEDFAIPNILHAATESELKQQFLDHLLRFQIKWASSTIHEKSFVNEEYNYSERLQHFLQRLPDNFLLLYEPIFLLKKAPVEVEVILLTPTEIWCLAFIEDEEDAAYLGSNEHFWTKKLQSHEGKVLNPAMSANRMGKIIKQLFQLYEVELPIRKAIVSRNGFIDFPDVPGDLILLDKRTYEEWFQRMRNLASPLKMMQIKGAKALLDYCQTTSFRRPDWDKVNDTE
ncbi:NERD domain-containing protein [Bacillus sp. FJAT-49732]|uniref:NERD domain-containing protein n=1 Tax=Lederbergia citrisecunda TaxID=2833583 RepID=A0A942TMK6_9BACI|nr:NERD domain-containing protein [Lederbergia citrisecunda]MBS4200053.1 NERD domain-containing protein [Lederbergia citrisecunda]